MSEQKSFVSGRRLSQPKRSNVYIAVMGVTGAGKSTFISKCCGQDVPIGHTLRSCTSEVGIYQFQFDERTTVHLVDTPGFNDTQLSDTEVLKEIAAWLTKSYTDKIQLSGIVYLHRISDVRMQGSQMRNLHMFKKLCGPDALRRVILATTMWDLIPYEQGETRERELMNTPDFWKEMMDRGSRVTRFAGARESALELIQSLINNNSKVTLELQKEMVNENKTLDNTSAGREVQAELLRERERIEKLMAETLEAKDEALRENDQKLAQTLAEQQERHNAAIAALESSSQGLRVTLKRLWLEKLAMVKKFFEISDLE